MSEYKQIENIKTEDNVESYEDAIEEAIMSKVKKFFDLHKLLRQNELNDFLESINLSDVFGSDEEKEIIWNIFSRLSTNSGVIDYETCRKGMRELFLFYGISGEETHDNTNNTCSNNYLYDYNSEYNVINLNSNTTPNKLTVSNFRESIGSTKDKKLDNLLLRISMKNNTPEIFPNLETPYLDTENLKRIEEMDTYVKTNQFEIKDKISQIDEPKQIKRTHERKITKIFTEIDIDKLQQLRKIFTLLDLRNKESVHLSEIQDVINKYKFIKLTPEELIKFLRLISDDIIKSGDNSPQPLQRLPINFELYSRAVSAIEQQLLQVNSDTFTEKNDSYEINENYNDIIDELNRMEYETVDHIMVLADIIKSSEMKVNETLIENYEKLLNENFSTDNVNMVRQNIKDGTKIYHNKIKDTQLFLKEINQFSIKKQNKLSSLKMVINRLEINLKNSEEDYRSLFETYNMNQPVEIDDETERLMEENAHLNELKKIKENKISMLVKEINDKDEVIFDLKNLVENYKSKADENKTGYFNLKKDYEELEKNYNYLVNDIYEKIEKDDEKEKTGDKKESSSGKYSSNSGANNTKDNENLKRFKEKLSQNEEAKKFFEMNFDQLVLYTLKIESLNKQLEEKNIQKELRLKEIEKELNELKKLSSENSKTIYQLKTENVRLQDKVSDMTKEVEMNNMFRPSRVLNNRISRISKLGDSSSRYSNVSNNLPLKQNKAGVAGRFMKMQKLFETDTTNNEINKSVDVNDSKFNGDVSQTDVRISTLDIDYSLISENKENKSNNYNRLQNQSEVNTINIDYSCKNNQNIEINEQNFNKKFTFQAFPNFEKNNENINYNNKSPSQQHLEIDSNNKFNLNKKNTFEKFETNHNESIDNDTQGDISQNFEININENLTFKKRPTLQNLEINSNENINYNNIIDINPKQNTNNIISKTSLSFLNTSNNNSNSKNNNQISTNSALEVSSFTNRNTGIFSIKDPFAPSEKSIFEEKNTEEEQVYEERTKMPKEKITRVEYSYRPDNYNFLDNIEDYKISEEPVNIITDYIEENPFPIKNDDDLKECDEESDTSVNWNKIAKHSTVDVDIKEMKENREKLKQSITRQNTAESVGKQIFTTKHTKGIPSLIKEEILEEDHNGEIIGTPSKPDKKSIGSNSLKKSISGSSNRFSYDENVPRTHTRTNTMELDMVFNKDSQYVCYDFLTLRKNNGIIEMLENNSEDVSSYEMFSDNVFLIDENNKKSKKYLFITSINNSQIIN